MLIRIISLLIISSCSFQSLAAQCSLAINLAGAALTCITETAASDEVQLRIPYTGMDNNFTITIMPLDMGAPSPIVEGDDPATQNGGTILIRMLFENVSYRITLVGDNCNFGSLTYPIPDGICGPLPVDLRWFNGRELSDGRLSLSWQTASEQATDYFLLQKSIDGGRSFRPISQVASAGSTEVPQTYEVIDPSPVEGDNFYRLDQFDLDGSVQTYGPLLIRLEGKQEGDWSVYPNPTQGPLSLIGGDDLTTGTIELWDSQGRFLQRFSSQDIDISAYPPGMYFMLYSKRGGQPALKRVMRF